MSMYIHTGVMHAIDTSIEMFQKMIILLEYIDHYLWNANLTGEIFQQCLPVMLVLFQLPMMLKFMLV